MLIEGLALTERGWSAKLIRLDVGGLMNQACFWRPSPTHQGTPML
jgi:hypothetical protein